MSFDYFSLEMFRDDLLKHTQIRYISFIFMRDLYAAGQGFEIDIQEVGNILRLRFLREMTGKGKPSIYDGISINIEKELERWFDSNLFPEESRFWLFQLTRGIYNYMDSVHDDYEDDPHDFDLADGAYYWDLESNELVRYGYTALQATVSTTYMPEKEVFQLDFNPKVD